jgi:hypothetical protein
MFLLFVLYDLLRIYTRNKKRTFLINTNRSTNRDRLVGFAVLQGHGYTHSEPAGTRQILKQQSIDRTSSVSNLLEYRYTLRPRVSLSLFTHL